MKVLTVYANPNPRSFCHAILENFSQGLKDAGHTNEVVDLYAIRFNPVLRLWDFASWIDETTPMEYLKGMVQSSTNRFVWFFAEKWLRNKKVSELTPNSRIEPQVTRMTADFEFRSPKLHPTKSRPSKLDRLFSCKLVKSMAKTPKD